MKIINKNLVKENKIGTLFFRNASSKEMKRFLNQSLKGKNYKVIPNGFFISCISKNNELPVQGWKIHVSGNSTNYLSILNKVIETISPLNISFKVVPVASLYVMLSKDFPREQAGKFITIYPQNKIQFITVLRLLSRKLIKYDGIPVLTDNAVTKVVSFRYGAFEKIPLYDTEGDQYYGIYNEKNNVVEDRREIGCYKPDWVEDINYGNVSTNIELEDKSASKMLRKYNFVNALQFSNFGGVYEATDKKTAIPVIVKEAKKYFGGKNFENVHPQDIRYLRRREYNFLRELYSCGFTPKPIDYFKTEAGDYLVEEKINGITLHEFKFENPIYYPNSTNEDYEKYVYKLSNIFLNIYHKISIINRKGYVLNDLTPNNILYDEDQFKVMAIDLESVTYVDEKIDKKLIYVTPGYSKLLETKKIDDNDLFSWAACLADCLISRAQLITLDRQIISKSLKFCGSLYGGWLELCGHLSDYFANYNSEILTKQVINDLELIIRKGNYASQ
ncbi:MULTISPECIES: serine/threonine-protein kinase [Lactobacillus]|uniref:Protein kinase domain-containing protein n=1 Tax=Lactobacillus xujianguonis TaxID=2495899 RepID=A0A437STT2_9LACO|nr:MULTISPECIES: serine/threonine-protein kinase [Lactobacillus]RVU70252.1 hypothetical protein EJK17_08665 [Lactobacillus xujianguonis]